MRPLVSPCFCVGATVGGCVTLCACPPTYALARRHMLLCTRLWGVWCLE